MEVEVVYCDRCGEETKYPKVLLVRSVSMRRDLCDTCVEALRAFLIGRPDPIVKTVYEVQERELESVLRHGAKALEHYADGATAGEMADHVRDMMSHASREALTGSNGNGQALSRDSSSVA